MQSVDAGEGQDHVHIAFYDRYAHLVYAYICRKVPCKEDAEDVARAITFLHHVNGQGKSSFETLPIESQRTTQMQVITNVRQRLLALDREQVRDSHMPQLALVAQKTPPGSPGSTTMSMVGMPTLRKRGSWQNRIGLLVAVAMLLLLVTSSVFVF